MAVTDTLINTLFDGRYRILRKLGSGGMANVYLAEDEDLGRRVAIKILNERYASDDSFNERFRREAKSAAGLSHPNIVSIYDRGEAEDIPYIAMEVIEGRSLKELIMTAGPLPIPQAVEHAKQILSALRFAHRNGIIHRDIKPHNILLGAEDRLKVTDFGIARAGASQMTEVGSIMGTAQYLSPEQARGAPVTAASDLYSVGIVLYEMLTGKTPFTGDTPIEIAMKHLNEPPRPPSELRSEITPELDQIVLRALAKDANERYQSAEEFSADLDRVEAGIPVSPETTAAATAILTGVPATDATQVLPPDAGTRVLPPRPTAPARRPPGYPPDYGYREPSRRRRRWVPWLLALLFVAAAAAAGWYVYSQIQDERNEPKPVGVPLVVGLREDAAIEQIEKVGLEPIVERESSTEQKAGLVARQDPGPDRRLLEGEEVTIFVSTGAPLTTVPRVVGMSYEEAVDALTDAGLRAKRTPVFSDKPEGEVVRQDPAANASVREGATVRLSVSQGQETVTVPDVLDQNRQSAEAELEANGFGVSVDSAPSDDTAEGLVMAQDPDPGVESPKGATVNITISTGPSSVRVPDVVGQDQASAQATLEDDGFEVAVREQDVTDPALQGLVIDQNPSGGVRADPGSRVTITVGRFVLGRGP
ncbi:MAG TPA: Stk1 family PASTA domain-containing Ser/Thr kinase [Actinomycetota bacterium]|nr:Stk1 family PASTA domain-containing Ser/Thr kinase [Actinomycetota bacterium]